MIQHAKNPFVIALLFACGQTFTQTPVVIDWSKYHEDDLINYIGWSGGSWTAKIKNNVFEVSANGAYEDVVINYITWNGEEFQARINEQKFVHAPKRDLSLTHSDQIINYRTHDGKNWTARILDSDVFEHSNGVDPPHQSKHINYLTWDNSKWTAQIKRPKFVHAKDSGEELFQITSELHYKTADNTNWIAFILADGTFRHTDMNGKNHFDNKIIYHTQDNSLWGARIVKSKFIHAPAFFAEGKPWLDKIFDTFDGINIKGGFPEVVGGVPANERLGTFVRQDEVSVYYRPIDVDGSCTNQISSFLKKNYVSMAFVKKCNISGQERNVYSFKLSN